VICQKFASESESAQNKQQPSGGLSDKANAADRIGWITPAYDRRFRYPADRAQAAVFQTREEAQQVIETLPEDFERAGICFSIEPAHSRHNETK
jgi:hypothetical protein